MSVLHWLLPIIGIGFVIFFHELGHFMAARATGVRVEAFSIGFGPRLFGFKRGSTDWKICLIPLGGFVKMAGGEEVMPNWAAVRVEVPWIHFERWPEPGRTGFVNRLSRWLIDARCRQQSYARMAVSLEPIVRAEDSPKSLFTPFGVLRNRFLQHAGVVGSVSP